MLFMVRVRVDLAKLPEFGRKLASGEFGPSSVRAAYCLQSDPAVGFSIWEAEDQAAFEKKFAQQRPYYAEVMEITPVVTAQEAQKMLMEKIKPN